MVDQPLRRYVLWYELVCYEDLSMRSDTPLRALVKDPRQFIVHGFRAFLHAFI